MVSNTAPSKGVKIFYCYAQEDRKDRNDLARHLSTLRWKGLIKEAHDLDISPGQEREKESIKLLDDADIILLLITKDFVDSYYTYEVQMRRAIERHEAGSARVIPILLRPVFLKDTPFSELQALPTNTKPVSLWVNRDQAYTDICKSISKVVDELIAHTEQSQSKQSISKPSAEVSERLLTAQSGSINSTLVADYNTFSQSSQNPTVATQQHLQETVNNTSSPQKLLNEEESDNWLHLRWLIFGSAVATSLVYIVGLAFHMTAIIALCLIPGAICLILGVVETSHFKQWYWLVGFLIISPLIGSLYAIVCPDTQPQRPINVKQLIIIVSFLGYAFFVVTLIFSSSFQVLADITLYISITLILSAWLIRLIHLVRLKRLSGEDVGAFFFPLAIPFVALMGLSSLDSQLNELKREQNE
jgi:hypothetical protein